MESPILFDSDGDLRLVVGGELPLPKPVEFIVCSKTLARASPALKSMFYGGFRESRGASSTARDWIVELPKDNPASMKVLLHIIHSQYEHVPTSMAFRDLQMIRIIRPWAKFWFQPHTRFANLLGNEIILWVGWQLGAKDVFRDVAHRLCVECEVNSDGELLDSKGKRLEAYDFRGPPGILGKLLT
jgi:hypothetical protein